MNPLAPAKRLIMPAAITPSDFLALANLVSEKGIKYFVETNANGQAEGLETAAKLGLKAHVCDPNTRNAQVLSQRYPDADLYDGNAADFLKTVLPKLDAPAFFWLSNELEQKVVEIESEGSEWFYELKPC